MSFPPEACPSPDFNQVPSLKSLIMSVSLTGIFYSPYLGSVSGVIPFSMSVTTLDNELQGEETRLIWFPSHQHSTWHMVGAQLLFVK